MKRQYEATGGEHASAPPTKEAKKSIAAPQRRAVPPGYLHDLMHTRHLMKTVGLRAPSAPSQSVRKPGLAVAVANARLNPAVTSRPSHLQPHHHSSKLVPQSNPSHHLPSLFEIRKKFLQKKRRRERDGTPYQQNIGKPIGLLSVPEDVMLKIVCYLRHEDIKPLFFVCKQLRTTLREAIRFHFNYATPSRGAIEETTPGAVRRPDRRRAVTALADVMAHLRQRNARTLGTANGAAGLNPPGSTHSTKPRVLSFTPTATPMSRLGTPQLARQLLPTPQSAAIAGPSAAASLMPPGSVIASQRGRTPLGVLSVAPSNAPTPFK